MENTSKQPRALKFLLLTELWERYGFYVIQAFLVLYVTQVLSFSDQQAFAIAGAFTALTYLSPIMGGYFAGHLLGYRQAIRLGGAFLIIGYASLAFIPHSLYAGLTMLAIGTGLFKPNISSLLGEFYTENDQRRASGFTLYYAGINFGGFLATASAGFIKDHLGWAVCYGLVSVGLIIGLIAFTRGYSSYGHKGLPPLIRKKQAHATNHSKEKNQSSVVLPTYLAWLQNRIALSAFFGVVVLITLTLLQEVRIAHFILLGVAVIVLCAVIIKGSHLPSLWRGRFFVALVLSLLSILYWAIFFQQFFSLNLFIERLVYRQWGNVQIPASLFLAAELLAVIVLGPLMAWMWKLTANHPWSPSLPMKFALAFLVLAMGFLVIGFGTEGRLINGFMHPLWLLMGYVIIAWSELWLSPMGMAMMTELVPPQLVGMMMGVWFMCLGLGGELGGFLAKQASIDLSVTDNHAMIAIYGHAFMWYAIFAFVTFVILAFATMGLRRLAETPSKSRDDEL